MRLMYLCPMSNASLQRVVREEQLQAAVLADNSRLGMRAHDTEGAH